MSSYHECPIEFCHFIFSNPYRGGIICYWAARYLEQFTGKATVLRPMSALLGSQFYSANYIKLSCRPMRVCVCNEISSRCCEADFCRSTKQ